MILTEQKLKDMKPGEIIATGVGTYDDVVNCEIMWVAKRGDGYHDWAIYYLQSYQSIYKIITEGDKMFTNSVIKRLVPCDDEAFNLYRR